MVGVGGEKLTVTELNVPSFNGVTLLKIKTITIFRLRIRKINSLELKQKQLSFPGIEIILILLLNF